MTDAMHADRGINHCYSFLVLITVLQGALKSTMMPHQHTYAVACKAMYDLKMQMVTTWSQEQVAL